MWSVRVDAVAGTILDQTNWTVYCQVDGKSFKHVHNDCDHAGSHHQASPVEMVAAADGTYNVWPWPVESPIHGSRQIVVDPHDPTASPYGWHDTNAQPGPEHTITRGNNVHAYEDSGNNDSSTGNEPDGGAGLVFDFPYDALAEPVTYTNAAVVNLFYWNNIMHDIAYAYGLTEASGNFQANNYGNGGLGNDFVRAEAQDGGGTNNANFGTPPDGGNGRMQMYLWDGAGPGEIFNVTAPASVAGPYASQQPGTGWGSGSYATTTGVTAEVVIIADAVADPYFSDGCQPLTNAADLVGRIALIDRGGCEFGFKAKKAQDAGAVGVIICNFEDVGLNMGPGAVGSQVNIPVVGMASVPCQTIRQFAGSGLVASIKIPAGATGPAQLDGDLDNGVIAHEYGHGISNRLTGGPSAAGCLGNQEQMGEGWSDFMSLITSAKQGDNGEQARGIGNYADGNPADGGGIRHYPYTRNMGVNPLTYGKIPGESIPHGVGAAWCTMIWDLYWNMADVYGWDPDVYHGTGGNNMAIKLVFDGMKNQPCSPGFVNGRDAILAADQALYGGANKCLIWKTFARRGLGLSASQGSSNTVGDEVEAFDIPCECRDKVSVTKSVTPFINAGEDINVTVNVSNCKLETRTNVVLKDNLPVGTTYKAGSASVPATASGNVLTLQLGDIAFEQTITVTYKLTTSPDNFSIRFFLDDVPTEDSDADWNNYDMGAPTPNAFLIDDTYSYSPDYAWIVPNLGSESRTALEMKTPWKAIGTRPVLRFFHLYDTQAGVDAGVLDVKKASENSFQQVADKMLRNGYPGLVQYGTFVTPNLFGWSGTTNGQFIPTYVDLSSWAGEDVIVRFRFGTDANTAGPVGWVVDDFEFMDLLSYNGEACVTTAQGENECVIAPEEGTIVESKFLTNTVETLADIAMRVFPNPAQDMVNIAISTESRQDLNLSLLTMDGRVMMNKKVNVHGNGQFQVNVSQLPAGLYLVKVATDKGVMVTKVVVE